MSFLKKMKNLTGDLAEGTKQKAQRGKLEIEVRRLEGKIDDEKNGLGHAIYPQLADGSVTVENADVADHLTKISALNDELAAKRKEIDGLGDDDDSRADEPAEAAVAS